MVEIFAPVRLSSETETYEFFAGLAQESSMWFLEEITLDFKKTTWFDANLCAILGAILSKVTETNSVKFVHLNDSVKEIFERNGFLAHFGGLNQKDNNNTTIKYRKFKTTDEQSFKLYLDNELLSKLKLPKMSGLLTKEINKSIFEIFSNCVIHSGCHFIFSCGQFFPSKKKLEFTIVDIGTTIKKNVNTFIKNQKFSGIESINWATIEGHTTKMGNIPGGLGLSLLREFLKKNEGVLQIISADGFWEQTKSSINTISMNIEFPGTILNLKFNLNDSSSYRLGTEENLENIF